VAIAGFIFFQKDRASQGGLAASEIVDSDTSDRLMALSELLLKNGL
jgi:hypothetical protein